MEPDPQKDLVPDALSAQDFTWMYNRVNNRSAFQNSRGATSGRGLSHVASSQGLPSQSVNATSALAPLPGWKGQEDLQRQSISSNLYPGTAISNAQTEGVSESTVLGWKNRLGLQLERAMVKPQEDRGLGNQHRGSGNQHADTVTSAALAPWPHMMSAGPWNDSAGTSGATPPEDTLAQEMQQMQGYGGFAPGETSTEALLAELHALQASMEVTGDSSQAGSGPGVTGHGQEPRHREPVDNAVRSFSLDSEEVLGFSMDNSYCLDDVLMGSSPPPQPLAPQPSGVSLLDNYLLGSADGAYSFYQAPQVSPLARPNPNRPISGASNQSRPTGNAPGLAHPVPSPLDLINKDFVSSFFSSGGLASASDVLPAHQGGGPALFPQAEFTPSQGNRKPHTFERSASLGQASEKDPAVPNRKTLFPFATFNLDHSKRPNVTLPPVTSDTEQKTSLGGLLREGLPSIEQLSAQSAQLSAEIVQLSAQRAPITKPLQAESENVGSGSRLVSAAEIMQALNRLPPRMTHRDFVKSANPRANQNLPSPNSHRRTLSVSSSLSTMCLQDVNAPELFVQMSDEKLVSKQVRALRGGYVSELAELRGWVMENLSEVVVPLIPGVHYLACNALPPARYKVARLMLSKVTLWIRQFQHNVRSISPVDLYMFIHEAARVFLDSDLSLLANIPSQEARDGFEKTYLVMEKMKKEAAGDLRFSDADVNPVKPNLDVKPRVMDPGLHGGAGLASDGSGSGLGGSSGVGGLSGLGGISGLDGISGSGGSLGLRDNPPLEMNRGSEEDRVWGLGQTSVVGQTSGLGQTSSLGKMTGLGRTSGSGSHLDLGQTSGLGQTLGSGSHLGLGQTSGSGNFRSNAGSGSLPGLGQDPGSAGEGSGRNKRKAPPESTEGLKKRLGFTNQLGNKGSEQQRQWLKGLQHELTKLNDADQVVMFNANPGGLAPVRRFVSEAGLMAKYNLRMASWRLLAAASEKFDTLAKGVLPSFEKYLGFSKYILGTSVGLTMAFCAIAGRQTRDGKWEPKAEAVQSLLERTKKGTELAAELACIMTDLRDYEEDLMKLRVNSVGVMMREGGRSQQDAVALLEQRAETILTALVAEVTSPPANNPVLWTCWQLIFDYSRAQVAFHVAEDLDAKVARFFDVKDNVNA